LTVPAWTLGLILLAPAGGPAGPDVSASYSFLRAGEADLHGVDLAGVFPFRPKWRLLADVSLHSGSFAGAHLKQTNFLAGARRRLGAGGTWQPFAQAMLGVARSTNRFEGSDVLIAIQTSAGGSLGVGTDYRLSPRWALRGQADYLILHSSAGWDGDPRLSVGVAFRFPR